MLRSLTFIASAAALIVGMAVGTSVLPSLAAPSAVMLLATTGDGFTYQGRLTNAIGQPVTTGQYNITLRAYSTGTGGTALATFNSPTTQVTNGLFTIVATGFAVLFDGQEIYIGVTVGADPELTPRQRVTPVPYAFSLRPSAVISGSVTGAGNSVVAIRNNSVTTDTAASLQVTAVNGPAISAMADGSSVPGSQFGTGTGIFAFTNSTNYTETSGVYGYGLSATGVRGVTFGTAKGTAGVVAAGPVGGTAIRAIGSGKIESTARSYLWLNGFNLFKADSIDPTTIRIVGGIVEIRSGAAGATERSVYVPITLQGVQYGQNVTIKTIQIFYRSSNATNAKIVRTDMLKINDTSGSQLIINDNATHNATTDSSYVLVPTGIGTTFAELSPSNGSVSLKIDIQYQNATDFIQLGGIVIQLAHDN